MSARTPFFVALLITGATCAVDAQDHASSLEDTVFELIEQARQSERDGQTTAALDTLDRAYLIARRATGEESAPVAVLFSEAGRIHLARGDAIEAVQHYAMALHVLNKLLPVEQFPSGHPQLVIALGNLAEAFRQAGQLKQAELVAARAVTMATELYPVKFFPKGHPHLASCWNTHGVVLQDLGRLNEARESLHVALVVRRLLYPADRFPDGHRELAITISNLANLDRMRCDYASAREEYHEAEAMWQRLYPADRFAKGHVDLARNYNNRGTLASETGDYAEARDCYERALKMFQDLHSNMPAHPDVARAHHNLGMSLERLGEMPRAGRQLRQAHDIYSWLVERGTGDGVRRELAWCCDSLGRFERQQGRLLEAAKYHRAALSHREQCFPADDFPQGHSELARSHEQIGNTAKLQGNVDEAIESLERAVAMNRRLYPAEEYSHGHRELSRSLNNLATAQRRAGRHQEALATAHEAVRAMRGFYPHEQFPLGHEDLAIVLGNRAAMALSCGEVQQGLQDLREAVEMLQRLPQTVAAELSEAEAVSLTRRLPELQDRLIVAWLAAGRSPADLYPVLWNSKGALLRMLTRRQNRWRASENPEVREQVEHYQRVRQQLAALYLHPTRTTLLGNGDAWRRSVDQLQREKEQLERQLAAASADDSHRLPMDDSTPTQLAERLPGGSAVVDYYFYRSPAGPSDAARLLVFVLGPRSQVHAHDLGPANDILDSLRKWREAIYAKDDPQGTKATVTAQAPAELHRRVWEPVERLLPAGTETVYIVPDGPLSLLPWPALPGRRADTYLIEDYALALAPHAPLLVEQFAAPLERATNNNLLAVGGIDYQQPVSPVDATYAIQRHTWTASDADYKRQVRQDDRDFLPGTLIEAKFAAYCGQRHPTLLCTGTKAGMEQITSALTRARWAVLSTHGNYSPPPKSSGSGAIAWDSQWLAPAQDRDLISGRSPLLRTFLELAGARQTGASHDAYLSAERIAALPLDNLSLVFLSACESGLGDLEAEEGIYNLPRAFHQAGTRNVVASLWRVNDFASQAMMRLVYYKIFVEHQPPITALRDAQRTFIRYPQELLTWDGTRPLQVNLDAPPSGPSRVTPQSWAAFYLSGSGGEG